MATKFVEEKLGISSGSGDATEQQQNSADLSKLNSHMADRSYIEGFTPSQSDVSVYKTLGEEPAGQYTHIARFVLVADSRDSILSTLCTTRCGCADRHPDLSSRCSQDSCYKRGTSVLQVVPPHLFLPR